MKIVDVNNNYYNLSSLYMRDKIISFIDNIIYSLNEEEK